MSLKPKSVDFYDIWQRLRCTAKAVITLDKVERNTWSSSFSDVYTLCVAQPEPFPEKLYEETRAFLTEHVSKHLKARVAGQSDISQADGVNNADGDGELLRRYRDEWVKYSKGVDYLHSLYSYLNQQHVRKQKTAESDTFCGNPQRESSDLMEIGELGLDIWRQHMLEPLSAQLVAQILASLAYDRKRTQPPMTTAHVDVVREVIRSYVDVQAFRKSAPLRLYEELFESKMLAESDAYYESVASDLLQRCTVSEYMTHVLMLIDEEDERAAKFLNSTSGDKIRKHCEQKLVLEQLQFIYSECKAIVTEERRTDMRNMYKMLMNIPESVKSHLVETFLEHIKSEAKAKLEKIEGDTMHAQFVEQMLLVHQKFHALIADVYSNDPLFIGALDKACCFVINMRPSSTEKCRSAEFVARYCDTLLKKSKLTDAEIEQKLSNNITIFKYIDEKDVFQKFYSKFLAKRLIHEQSHSMDSEEQMINKLKQACGFEFTNKLHRMFTDISLSQDQNIKFNLYQKTQNVNLGNFTVKVLQAGAWPLGAGLVASSFALPTEFEKPLLMFEKFYRESFNGRRLTWLYQMCHGELKMSHLSKTYIVTMQTYQMAIMMLFEATEVLACHDIESRLSLTTEVFQRHAQTLVDAKLLIASADSLSGETTLALNPNFSNKRMRFKINSATVKEVQQEVEQTNNSIEEDRKLYLQAAIVRIMKSRKVLKHNALIQELLTVSSVTFTPSVAMIKKSIESLIDKQYLERTPNSGDEYSYVA